MLGLILLLQTLTRAVSGPATSSEYLPIRVAESEGYFAREGLDVTVRTTRAESGAAEALAQGQVDLAATTLEALLRFGPRVPSETPRLVFGLTAAPPFSVLVATAQAGAVRSVEDLAGLRVGVTTPGAPELAWFGWLLARASVSVAQLHLTSVGGCVRPAPRSSPRGSRAASRALTKSSKRGSRPRAPAICPTGSSRPRGSSRRSGSSGPTRRCPGDSGSRAPRRCFTSSPCRRRSRRVGRADSHAEVGQEPARLLDRQPHDIGIGADEPLHERPTEVLDRVGPRLVERRSRGDVTLERRVGVDRHAHPAHDGERGLAASPAVHDGDARDDLVVPA